MDRKQNNVLTMSENHIIGNLGQNDSEILQVASRVQSYKGTIGK